MANSAEGPKDQGMAPLFDLVVNTLRRRRSRKVRSDA